MYLSDLYQSVFLTIREPGVGLVKHFIRPGDTVLDVGANIGRFTTLAASLAGRKGRVYSFEPLTYPASVLARMLALRRLRQVTLVRAALTDSNGTATMTIPLKHGRKPKTSLGHLGERRDNEDHVREEQVRLTTLDDFCAAQRLDRLDFMKCDVEGFELSVFQGGRRTLAAHAPVIFCEIDRRFCDHNGIAVSDIFALLAELGYTGYLPRGDRYLFPASDLPPDLPKAEFFFITRDRSASYGHLFRPAPDPKPS